MCADGAKACQYRNWCPRKASSDHFAPGKREDGTGPPEQYRTVSRGRTVSVSSGRLIAARSRRLGSDAAGERLVVTAPLLARAALISRGRRSAWISVSRSLVRASPG